MAEILGALIALITAVYAYIRSRNKAENINFDKIPEQVRRWIPVIKEKAQKIGVPFDVAMGVLWVESAGDPDARGSTGEYGLYQLKPIAIQDLQEMGYGNFSGYKTLTDENINAGLNFLLLQYKRTGNWNSAIRAYNQGFTGMQKDPGFSRSMVYHEKVKQKMKFFQ